MVRNSFAPTSTRLVVRSISKTLQIFRFAKFDKRRNHTRNFLEQQGEKPFGLAINGFCQKNVEQKAVRNEQAIKLAVF
jgi:hypothetical protein